MTTEEAVEAVLDARVEIDSAVDGIRAELDLAESVETIGEVRTAIKHAIAEADNLLADLRVLASAIDGET